MKKLFDALADKWPDYELVDLKFSVDHEFIGPVSVEHLDEQLAEAVQNAEESNIDDLYK